MLTPACISIDNGSDSPVRLNTQLMTTLKAMQKITNTTGRCQLASGQPPHSVKNSGRCPQAPDRSSTNAERSGPIVCCMRARAKSRQPGSSPGRW